MKIHIEGHKTLAQIQDEFHKAFPYLKLHFFSKPHGAGEGSPNDELLDAKKTVGEISAANKEGDVTFDKDTKVSELEQAFQDNYGISAQVFRKAGSSWLETSKTDDWTLEKQNDTGKESDTKYNINTHNYARKD